MLRADLGSVQRWSPHRTLTTSVLCCACAYGSSGWFGIGSCREQPATRWWWSGVRRNAPRSWPVRLLPAMSDAWVLTRGRTAFSSLATGLRSMRSSSDLRTRYDETCRCECVESSCCPTSMPRGASVPLGVLRADWGRLPRVPGAVQGEFARHPGARLLALVAVDAGSRCAVRRPGAAYRRGAVRARSSSRHLGLAGSSGVPPEVCVRRGLARRLQACELRFVSRLSSPSSPGSAFKLVTRTPVNPILSLSLSPCCCSSTAQLQPAELLRWCCCAGAAVLLLLRVLLLLCLSCS